LLHAIGQLPPIRALREGDVLVIWKLDRLGPHLGSSDQHRTELSQRPIGLKVLTGQCAQIDTTTTAAA
jgi:DNA invertase Pin-like site-specific DNA recombinase